MNVSKKGRDANKELGAFLSAVSEVFGPDQIRRAADLWIRVLEAAEWTDADCMESARVFRQITIHASAQLSREATPYVLPHSSQEWLELKQAS